MAETPSVVVPTWAEHNMLAEQVADLARRVAALEHAPPPDPEDPEPTRAVRVNCGGPEITTADGRVWAADTGFAGGGTSDQGAGRVQAGPLDALYGTERWGAFTYRFTGLPVGPARVTLFMAEAHAGTTRAGQRQFTATVNGRSSGPVDLVAEVGHLRPWALTVETTIPTSGVCTVAVEPLGGANAAGVLQGIEILCYGTGVPEEPPQAEPGTFWISGGSPDINKVEGTVEFGNWRGRPGTCALAYITRDHGWGPFTSIVGQPALWASRKDMVLIVQMPFFPQGAYTYAAAARGEYDGQWRQFAAAWKAREDAGYARPWFSPGWEANHNGADMHYWGGPGGGPQRYQSYGEYTATWRRFHGVTRSIYPDARFCWTPNGHDSIGFYADTHPANDPRNIYPGKDYVDAIGVDYYDQWPPSTRVPFDVEANDVNGIRWYMRFAEAEGRQFAVPEWSVVSQPTPNHGGDNPAFIRNMHAVFTEAWGRRLPDGRRLLAFECAYPDEAQRMNMGRGQNPQAAAEYRRLWAAA